MKRGNFNEVHHRKEATMTAKRRNIQAYQKTIPAVAGQSSVIH
jgi:hypothetical protein